MDNSTTDPSTDFATFRDTLTSALLATTRSTTALTTADLPFHRALDPSVGASLDAQNARLAALAGRFLGSTGSSDGSATARRSGSKEVVGSTFGSGRSNISLADTDAIDNAWTAVVDVIDSLLEKADACLDEYTGAVKKTGVGIGAEQAAAASKASVTHIPTIYNPSRMVKPQTLFEHVPRNDETAPFKPLLTAKPYAMVPLENCCNTVTDEEGMQHFQHPYRTEITQYRYPPSMYHKSEPIPFKDYETTSATFVDTPEGVAEMLSELKEAKEIAIDLEHHDTRSFAGLLSLMQISTRDKDWIVDTLQPWRRRLECLNEVFANPNIIKVLHGAYMDIIWLQRDLGLYVVGLFDTYHAARTLGYEGAGLAFLLLKFADFKANKKYQLADWRVRPLPPELLDYARSDTHFLLYIFDNMRNELIDRSTKKLDASATATVDPSSAETTTYPSWAFKDSDRLEQVRRLSAETSLQTYEHPFYDAGRGLGPTGWLRALQRANARFSSEQVAVFRAVHAWRDRVARTEDEGVNWVLPQHALFSAAREMPEDRAALFATVHPVNPVLRRRADEFVEVVRSAKEEGSREGAPDSAALLIEHDRAKRERWATRNEVAVGAPKQAPAEATEAAPVPARTAPSFTSFITAPLRTLASGFWGRSDQAPPTASRPAQPNERKRKRDYSTMAAGLGPSDRPTPASDVSLAIPLPPLTAQIFRSPAEEQEQAKGVVEPGARAEHMYVKGASARRNEEDGDDVFVVKALGGGRQKRGGDTAQKDASYDDNEEAVAAPSPPAPFMGEEQGAFDEGADEILLGEPEPKRRRGGDKKEKKSEKKKARREQRLQREMEERNAEPFDYAAAPSVLHAARGEHERGQRASDMPFRDAEKAGEGELKGLPRKQKGKAGRSAVIR
ncbi:hypothetical protein BDY21DRAFT_370135 [Lineolata rhizophorae]|uniref:HRDC domain-containing protein n=1 Tax=Lineolata rhizophorae TaxID=578093 RepID=A0A6A6P6J6_9PEZI|nr:hypothetical protein BDY21DRAFT_370135 [Lineolata rhizophorae]